MTFIVIVKGVAAGTGGTCPITIRKQTIKKAVLLRVMVRYSWVLFSAYPITVLGTTLGYDERKECMQAS
ncbi:MAG: hypothetical protein AB7G68_11475 [Nitrospiraceae bacterium]